MKITPELMDKLVPDNPNANQWADEFEEVFDYYEITTPLRIAHFIAQVGHESNGLRVLQENLNYSAQGLLRVFPKYFPNEEIARAYAMKPQMIANRVYANRMGNGNEASGDGFKYRGRGLIQLTGKNNYRAASLDILGDETLVKDPDLVTDPFFAAETAGWFWKKNNLNPLADANDIEKITLRINGGKHGLDDRKRRFNIAMKVLSTL
ncbi:MAG: glycoside hydrolase family 19 protein [Fischerella sp.]|nr:glycoside hydrolase family 19 protein [Fischerella sp.]